jgi:polar amino acid transport system substrate-binding protein/two-component system sensor histidine kinase EvgS
MPYIDSMAELKEMRVAVVKDYAPDEWISRRYPNLPLTRTKTLSSAFDLLSDGQVDVVVGSLLVGNYYLSKRHDHNIKIAGDTPYTYKLRMAVRKDWPIFARILQKALNDLPQPEKSALYRKWIWIKYEHGFNYSMLAKVIMGTLVIILLFVYWNRKLASEISRRKLIQEALAESESALRKSYADLRELEEMKENLTHMIVHDMRSPLMTISASLELLQEDIPQTNLNDDVKNGLLMAKASTREAADMAQDLLDVGRLESGGMPLEKNRTDIKTLTEAAIQTMEIQARLADINIVLSGESVFAFIDPNIIRRVLINLLGNAIKASSRNSTVNVRTFAEQSKAIVEIQDEGCGIPREYQDRLFNKFVSFEIGRPKHRTSVGLGLVFCKMAIKAHGGHISVDSTEGSGSTFTFFIPKKPEP